jgi:hypothetical protein
MPRARAHTAPMSGGGSLADPTLPCAPGPGSEFGLSSHMVSAPCLSELTQPRSGVVPNADCEFQRQPSAPDTWS